LYILKYKRPGKQAVSFLCEFQKDALISSLNAPAANFKELVPGTQYWSKLGSDKVPINYPNQVIYDCFLKISIIFLKLNK
jgi:hypothetical protein